MFFHSLVVGLVVNGRVSTVNYTHNVLDQPPRKYDCNNAVTPTAAAGIGAAAWDCGEGAPCGKATLTPPHEAGVGRALGNGFVCYDNYDIVPVFEAALLDFDHFNGLPNGAFAAAGSVTPGVGTFLLTDFHQGRCDERLGGSLHGGLPRQSDLQSGNILSRQVPPPPGAVVSSRSQGARVQLCCADRRQDPVCVVERPPGSRR